MNLDNYPLAKFRFFGWMIGEYGVTEQTFSQAPFEERCRALARFLGHPTVFPSSWTNDTLEDQIYDYLYIYESALLRFPYGADDYNERLQIMDYTMREIKHPEMWQAEKLMPSLRDCIIERHYHMDTKLGKPRPTLSSCIIALANIIEPEIDDEKFWDENILFAQQNHKAPF